MRNIPKWIIITICLTIYITYNGHCQRVQIYTNKKLDTKHLSLDDTIRFRVATPLNTRLKKDSEIEYFFLANNNYEHHKQKFSKIDTVTNFFDLPLQTNIVLKNGIHSFFIQFPDGFVRGYNCIVSDSLVNDTVNNIHERLKLNVNAMVYQELLRTLDNKMKTNSATIIKDIPTKLKAVACIDFLGLEGFGSRNTVICMVSQYLFSQSTDTSQRTDLYFREFLGEGPASPLYVLLSGAWQMQNTSFNKDRQPSENDVFSVQRNNYKIIKPATPDIDKKIRIAYWDTDPNFRRILIFVNN